MTTIAHPQSLRDYQQSVLDKLAKSSRAPVQSSALGIVLNGEPWLIDMAEISEVLPMPRLSPVPRAQPWFLGIANIRGSLFGVTDLAEFLGLPLVTYDAHARLVLLAPRLGVPAGFRVPRVLGLRNPGNWKIEMADGHQYWRDSAGERWRKLELATLLAQPEFMQIAA